MLEFPGDSILGRFWEDDGLIGELLVGVLSLGEIPTLSQVSQLCSIGKGITHTK